jgi:uncharacterized protein (DUF2062 family)
MELWSIVLGSAAIGAIVSSTISALVTYKLKQAEIKEGRIRMAMELARLKSDQVRTSCFRDGGK